MGKAAGSRTRAPSDREDLNWGFIRELARKRLGISRFRPGQRELIETILRGDSAIGVLPTGAGKSLCFQIPALVLPGTVIVVSPLIALMQDQKEHLDAAGIQSARLDSTVSASEQRALEQTIAAGDHAIVLVTPERLQNPEHLAPLKTVPISLFVIDEAHCICQWGHDFRPAYAQLHHVIEELGNPPVLALTATAPPDVLSEIQEKLGMPQARVIHTGIERENLMLEVLRTVNREEKEQRALEILHDTVGSGIIYCATVRRTDEIYLWLKNQGFSVERYHGQMTRRDRSRSQQRFISGESQLIVATNAFGLGIDKPDVRLVLHWHFPGSVESYYQEAGRAGRDGEPARCVLLYRLEDKRIRSFFLGGKHPRKQDVQALLNAFATGEQTSSFTIAQLAKASGLTPRRVSVLIAALEDLDMIVRDGRRLRLLRRLSESERNDFMATFDDLHAAEVERLRAMMAYGDTVQCRMQFLREYFGQPPEANCNHCDNCLATSHEPRSVQDRPQPSIATMSTPIANDPLAVGAKVRHKSFGSGEILRLEDTQAWVLFPKHGERRVLASRLRIVMPAAA